MKREIVDTRPRSPSSHPDGTGDYDVSRSPSVHSEEQEEQDYSDEEPVTFDPAEMMIAYEEHSKRAHKYAGVSQLLIDLSVSLSLMSTGNPRGRDHQERYTHGFHVPSSHDC